MFKKILFLYKNYFQNLLTALVNLFIFFPYFFSIKKLFQTLFFPWKNLVYNKKKPQGFSFSYLIEKFSFNLISSAIGFMMRFSLLAFWFLWQTLYSISIPIIFIFSILISPIFLVLNFLKDQEEEKNKKKRQFLKDHFLKEENKEKVEEWFENYYQEEEKGKLWYRKENLFNLPPLARDWAFGYTYLLNQFGLELTTQAYLENRPAVIDRENEITQIEEVLSKSKYNNALIIGEEGVGKHSIIDALAYRMFHGLTTPQLIYHRLIKLDMEKILTVYQDQKSRELFFDQLLNDAVSAGNIIIFIDKIDRYLSSSEITRVDLSIPLEKYAKTSNLQIIGVTTPFLYQKFIFPLEKINQLFTKVEVEEVSLELAEKIMLKIALNLEKKYQIKIPYETIQETINKSSFYLTYIPFPEKAIELLDLACIKAQLSHETKVLPETVNQVLTEKTKIPTQLNNQLKEKIINLEDELKKEIFGQDFALKKLSMAIARAFILIGKRKKPLASFLFLGPTGVGKTETAKLLAETFFGSKNYLLRFDMSLYQKTEDIEKLIGSYKTNYPGILTETIRNNPYGVLLLDEIEKSNPKLLNIFLTILDEGYFTDGFGKKVDCKNLIIIATSNAGSDLIFNNLNKTINDNFFINYLIEKKFFSPEFLNRFDSIIFYQPLSEKTYLQIGKKVINLIKKEFFDLYQINIEVSENYLLKLIKTKVDPRFGARNLNRIIKEETENKIINYLLKNKISENFTLYLDNE